MGWKRRCPRSLRQEQILVLWVFGHLGKYLFPPPRLPMGKITHAGEQEILRTHLLHQPQLIGEKLRLFKIINHVEPADIVSGIAVAAPDVTADHEIHILNTILNADSHR